MSTLENYQCYILRQNNDYDLVAVPAKNADRLKSFVHRGHKYKFDSERSFIIHEPFSIRYWLIPDRFRRYDRMMIFREPADPLHGVEIPIESLTVPAHIDSYEESPDLLKGVTRSQVLHRYRSKQRFGRFRMPPWWVLLILGLIVVASLLLLTGTISIPGIKSGST